MTERRPRGFSKDAKIAQLLCIVFEIPHDHQKLMHEKHVLSLVEWDHFPIRYADGGTNHFSNAQPLLIGAHREKTAKIDAPERAKGKHLRSSEIVRRYKEIQKHEGPAAAAELYPAVERLLQRRKAKIANRGFPKQHRPLRSRNNLRRRRS